MQVILYDEELGSQRVETAYPRVHRPVRKKLFDLWTDAFRGDATLLNTHEVREYRSYPFTLGPRYEPISEILFVDERACLDFMWKWDMLHREYWGVRKAGVREIADRLRAHPFGKIRAFWGEAIP